MNLSKFSLSADRKTLILLAGLMWAGVGIMLVRMAIIWLYPFPAITRILFFSAGFLIALPIHHLGFLKIADKNLKRLMPLTSRKSIFSFITPKSYLIIVVMISLGMVLRHSEIPKQYLSIVYTGIGSALFLSGIRYFRFFLNQLFQKE